MEKEFDLIIIGGGQSSLACGYFLRRSDLDYLILDDQETCGGSWPQTWESLTLFSPSKFSSLPGFMMPSSEGNYPSMDEAIAYLCAYEERYDFPIKRNARVTKVALQNGIFHIHTADGKQLKAKAVISATGTWQKPFIPEVPGRESFQGIQIHSVEYQNAEIFKGKKILREIPEPSSWPKLAKLPRRYGQPISNRNFCRMMWMAGCCLIWQQQNMKQKSRANLLMHPYTI